MQINVYSGSLSRLCTQALVVGCFEDIRPLRGLAAEIDWYYSGIFSRMLMQGYFSGKFGGTLLVPTAGKLNVPKVILMGLGKSTAYDYEQFKRAGNFLFYTVNNLNVHECAVEIDSSYIEVPDTIRLVASFISGWKSADLKQSIRLTFVVNGREQAKLLQYKIQNGNILKNDRTVRTT